jgi:hypothetical protein
MKKLAGASALLLDVELNQAKKNPSPDALAAQDGLFSLEAVEQYMP